MVLQQGQPGQVWGTADPSEDVTVTLNASNGSTLVKTAADKDGKWDVKLTGFGNLIPTGGPYTLSVKGKNEITIKDVYIGEVWIASGQSNMEWSVNNSAGAKEAKENAKNPKLRLFTVKKTAADEPQTTVPVDKEKKYGVWVEAGPNTIGGFSAVAYFFGRDLQKDLDVPVGIIHTSWGGTASEQWTSQ